MLPLALLLAGGATYLHAPFRRFLTMTTGGQPGARLAGLGHPAFLAGVCLPAIYACLIQLYREGRGHDLGHLRLADARPALALARPVAVLARHSLRREAAPGDVG